MDKVVAAQVHASYDVVLRLGIRKAFDLKHIHFDVFNDVPCYDDDDITNRVFTDYLDEVRC
jgi:hypothetical protein